MDLGSKINNGLKRKGMSQSELAEKLGIKQQSVGKWISNKSSPTAENLIEIIKILDLKDEFFDDGSAVDEEDPVAIQEALKSVPVDYLKKLDDRLTALEKRKSLRDVDEIFREMMEGIDRQLLLSTLRCLMRLEKKEIEKFFDFTDQENFIEEFKSFLNRTRRNKSIQKKVFS